MTTDHADDSLAEALWFAIDLAIREDVKEAAESAVVIGVDSPGWRTEILARIADLDELRCHVVETSSRETARAGGDTLSCASVPEDTPTEAPTLASVDAARVTMGTAYEDGVFTVALAEENGAGVLLFSRSDVIDERDSLLAMDAYSVSTESGATFYGGVESATLDETGLELQLTEEAAGALRVSPELLLRFTDRAEAEAARAGLRRVGIATIGRYASVGFALFGGSTRSLQRVNARRAR